ncbi:MAG: N-6 DNA methylase [Planctomycetaceae bacterium]
MAGNHSDLEKRLWDAADELRANSKLKSSEYSVPVLGLIFLRFADNKFAGVEKELAAQTGERRRRTISKTDYLARGVYLPESARFKRLLELPEGANIGKEINDAMKAIEDDNPDLKGVLPRTYNRLENSTLVELLKTMNRIPPDIEGDAFGKIYEYFLGKFAMSEGQKGGEDFTPRTVVKLIVAIIEPFHGKILDQAGGSGGMFVQSAEFVKEHRKATTDISIYGQEKVAETVRLCKMNLAVHGLGGDIREGNTYYEDLHQSVTKKGQPGEFDFVMANPPFNVNRVDKSRLADDPRFPFGLPTVDNGNYLWIQIFASALNARGRAGFVMANSASDARGSEQLIRQKLIEAPMVDVMVAVGSNFFYTVTLPCTLWFLDRAKATNKKHRNRDHVLFIDARHIFTQIDRAHREFTPAQIEFLANIVRLYRGEPPENHHDSAELLKAHFPKPTYADIPGLCKRATVAQIEEQGWSLNPGRYVGVAEGEAEDFDFTERLEELNEELETLNGEAHELEERIAGNVALLLEPPS